VVSRIQGARKEMKLPYEARIEVVYEAEGELAQAMKEHLDWIAGEVLSTKLAPEAPSGAVQDFDIDGMRLRVAIRAVPR
jgi:hypothetical protein